MTYDIVVVDAAGYIFASNDGDAWVAVVPTSTVFDQLHGLVFGPDRFVAVGRFAEWAHSEDGETWLLFQEGGSTGPWPHLQDVIYVPGFSGGRYVAVGGSGTTGNVLSMPGIWNTTGLIHHASPGHAPACVAHGAGLFVIDAGAMGNVGVRTSPDLVTWTARTTGFGSAKINDVIWTGTSFIAVANAAGEAYRSIDGITWAAVSTGLTQECYGVWAANGKVVVVGDNGQIAYSTNDGLTFTTATVGGFANRIADVAYDSDLGLWITAGAAGEIKTSPDGITWAQSEYVNYAQFTAIAMRTPEPITVPPFAYKHRWPEIFRDFT